MVLETAMGLIEDIHIHGIGTLKAKTDTGNSAHNVLHGIVKGEKNGQITFESESGEMITLPYEDAIKIHIGSGNKEHRPVVKLDVSLNGKTYKNVPFSIADRTENEYKVLLGKDFIKANGGIVDVTKED